MVGGVLLRRPAGFSCGFTPRGGLPVGEGTGWTRSRRLEALRWHRSGTREIRIKDATGAYRIIYVAKFEEAIYVLHCFQKKTETTAKHDKDIAEVRYRAIVQERMSKR